MKDAVDNAPIPNMRDLYLHFLKTLEKNLNPVTLVQIVTRIVKIELEASAKDGLAFLTPLLGAENQPTVFTKNPEAHVLLLSHVASLQMKDSDHPASKRTFEKASEIVTNNDMTAQVYSVYYRAAAEYHKVVGTAADFFQNALQFLAYTPAHAISTDSQQQWAFDIGMAALVGNGIYNFGEVLSHAIVHSLRGTEQEWLLLLLEAFSTGNLDQFDAVCSASSDKMVEQPVLVANEEFLKQKITILALLELAFSRSLEHSISFEEVKKACRLPPREVEYLLMRAMSLGLISGVIDNVDERFSVTRVRPRVLGREPIGQMAKRLSKWCGKVDNTINFVDGSSIGIAE